MTRERAEGRRELEADEENEKKAEARRKEHEGRKKVDEAMDEDERERMKEMRMTGWKCPGNARDWTKRSHRS